MQLARKDILDMASLSVEEIELILNTADTMKEISERPIKKVPTLRGKTVVLFFYEPSTRTRTSFDIAAKRLSADSLSLSKSSSSTVKGETLIDTARNLESMKPDAIVLRHSSAGAPHMLAPKASASKRSPSIATAPRRATLAAADPDRARQRTGTPSETSCETS